KRADPDFQTADSQARAIAPVLCGAGCAVVPSFPRACYRRELGKPNARCRGDGAPSGATSSFAPFGAGASGETRCAVRRSTQTSLRRLGSFAAFSFRRRAALFAEAL